MSKAVRANLELFRSMVIRDIEARFQGSLFGRSWPLLLQVAQLLIYMFVFSFVLRVPLALEGFPSNSLTYGVWLFAGLLPWYAFSTGLGGASTRVISQPNLVKKVVFPLNMLPWIPVATSFIEMLWGLLVLVAILGLLFQTLHWTMLFLPVIWYAQICLTAGLSYFAASLTVYIRDIPHMVGIALNLGFFLTPIIYPAQQIPEKFRLWILLLNPLASLAECYRDVLLLGVFSHWRELVVTLITSQVVLLLGYLWYEKLKKGFADVL